MTLPLFMFLLQSFSCTPHIIKGYTFPDTLIGPGVHGLEQKPAELVGFEDCIEDVRASQCNIKMTTEYPDIKCADEKFQFKAVPCFFCQTQMKKRWRHP